MNEATQKVALEEGSHTQEKRAYVARAYAAAGPTSGLAAATIRRREPGPEDVQIEILYCSICHSDLHQVRNEWSGEIRAARPLEPEACRSRSLALCRNHNLLAHAALGCHQGQESWRGRSRRPRSHGREVCTCDRSRRCRLHDVTQKRRKTHSASEQTRSSFRGMRRRCKSTLAALTSFSMLSQRITTSTRTSICCAAMATLRLLVRRRSFSYLVLCI